MGYRQVEDSLAVQLQAIDGFSVANVVQGRYQLLDEGVGSAIVLAYNRFTREDMSGAGLAQMNWIIDCDLYVRYIDDAQMHLDAAVARQLIIDRVHSFPLLGGTTNILNAVPLDGSARPETVMVGSQKFHRETISILAEELIDYDLQE